MKRVFIPYFLIAISLLFNACDSSNRPARGPEDEIYVVADSTQFEELRTSLETVFEKIIYTPQPEKLFILKRIPLERLEQNKNKKNIIIVAPLESGSNTAQFIDAIIDSSAKKKILQDSSFAIRKYGLWARDQLVTILTAPTMQELEFDILREGDNLLYAYQKISDKRLFESLYNAQYEQEDVEGKLLRDYGWIIYVQADYKVAINDPENNFVWLRRSPGSDMERWVFVHWVENASPAYLNVDSIKAVRNRVTEKYYRTTDDSAYVVIAQDYFTTNEVNFNGRYAILTQGLWDLNIKGMGGPFVNYSFFDENKNRFYMLDGAVFAPKYYKRNLIHQMDVTLQSFMTEEELSPDRKDDLLSAIED